MHTIVRKNRRQPEMSRREVNRRRAWAVRALRRLGGVVMELLRGPSGDVVGLPPQWQWKIVLNPKAEP